MQTALARGWLLCDGVCSALDNSGGEVTARTILLTLHITFIGSWLGANVVQFILTPRFDKIGGAGNVEWNRAIQWLGGRYYGVLGGLVLATGAGLVSLKSTPYEFSSGFVDLGIAIVVLAAVLGAAVFSPLQTKRVNALESGDDAAASALKTRILGFGAFDTALLLLTIVAMVHKWRA
jgi:hypothetical protein